ncbi:hypothetical protein L1276_000442 [Flavobacterium sp. HSC-32F16]|uniref:hypothetical protein n=1 Tax=Flavobacterium sp. HSC-32F16 TaxID=2910964 RepID=UPI0020A44691|nr:hypothetical protein [Flavobacterium sp. HSC-32F16]MCP2025302.1 hypothetical protein [Flavobacterium sp. HSC-32F16]
MCQSGKEIKLCTCVPNGMDTIIHHKNSRKNRQKRRVDFTWTLQRCMGYSKTTMDGMGYRPEDALTEDLTNERMLVDLNSKNCFDFDYQPSEGDNLLIFTPESFIREHLSFIFKNGEWIADSHMPFLYEMKKINFGTVTFEDKTEK